MKLRSKATGVLVLLGMTAGVQAQWQHPDPRAPRTRDGKVNLTAPAPRLNGKPDFTGTWQGERAKGAVRSYLAAAPVDAAGLQIDSYDASDIHRNVFFDIKREDEPLTPAAVAVLAKRQNQQPPQVRCLPQSVPGVMMVLAVKIIQTPQQLLVLNESAEPPLQIYLDGRALPKDPDPTWTGYSVGHWEGDTLVVETTGFNEEGWLDNMGHPRGENMRITQRFRRRDFGHIDIDIRYEDPKYYTRPFTNKVTLNLLPDSDIIEYVCTENEKDMQHLNR